MVDLNRQKEIQTERDRIEKEIRGVCSDGGYVIENPNEGDREWWNRFLDARIIFYEGQLGDVQKKCRNVYHRRKNKRGNCPDCGLKTFKL